VAAELVTQTVHLDHDGESRQIARVPGGTAVGEVWTPHPVAPVDTAIAYPAHAPLPLGRVFGARSGDKGGNANIGVWIRPTADVAAGEMRAVMCARLFHPDGVRELLPETADLAIEVWSLPNLGAVNIVVHGLLGRGVADSTSLDPQAKGLAELLRARVVDLPVGIDAQVGEA
jgi:hypothetical protein